MRWFIRYEPRIIEESTDKVEIRVTGVYCPNKGGVHANNGAYFDAWFGTDARGRPCITHCFFQCADTDECRKVRWRPEGDPDAVAFPEKYA